MNPNWGDVAGSAPLAGLGSGVSGLSASLPQNESHGHLAHLVDAVIPDAVEKGTEAFCVLAGAAAADVAPAVFSAVESGNVGESHD